MRRVTLALLTLALVGLSPQALAQSAAERAEEQGLPDTDVVRVADPTPARGGLLLCQDDLLLIPDSDIDNVASFDPVTGNLVDPSILDDAEADSVLSTPINAIPNFDRDGIFVSDQFSDGVYEFDCSGKLVGLFAPAGGVDNTILDNIRGIDISERGTLLVTVGGGANEDSIAEFDQNGNYLGNFTDQTGSPFDVFVRDDNDDVLVSDIDNEDILRFDQNGNLLGIFVDGDGITSLDFPEQIQQADNKNILVAGFSSPSGVYEYDANGNQVGYYDAETGLRGVYELPNGNLLVTNSGGVSEITRSNTIVRDGYANANRFIELFAAGGGDDFGVSCSGGGAVAQGGTASFSYEVCNNTDSAASGVVFFTASQGGNQVAGPTQVQSGTLAANSCTGTQSFNVRVPANAPTGDYTLTISAGSDAGSAVASCDVDVTVTGSTRPAGAAATWSLLEATAWAPALAAGEAEAAVGVFPNPLRDGATLRYAVEADAEVRLAVYDVLGREVAVLAEGAVEAGSHSAAFDASGLPAGVYVYRLAVGATVETGRMTVVR